TRRKEKVSPPREPYLPQIIPTSGPSRAPPGRPRFRHEPASFQRASAQPLPERVAARPPPRARRRRASSPSAPPPGLLPTAPPPGLLPTALPPGLLQARLQPASPPPRRRQAFSQPRRAGRPSPRARRLPAFSPSPDISSSLVCVY
uniref:Uncharacterized protein n=2 Tax=Aegilops tauschii subsp. strangulata TaxID=200361 RepID=A0A453BAT7_AEGTS